MKKTTLLMAIALITTSSLSHAEENSLLIGSEVGTMGAGIAFKYRISDTFAVRANANGLTFSDEGKEISDIKYDGELKLDSVGVFGDYIFRNGFKLSAGAYINENKITGISKPKDTDMLKVGDGIYPGKYINKISAEASFNNVSPYIGAGWQSNRNSKGWGFSIDIGAMYQGSPELSASIDTVDATGLSESTKTKINSDFKKEIRYIEEELEDYEWYPIVVFGVYYGF